MSIAAVLLAVASVAAPSVADPALAPSPPVDRRDVSHSEVAVLPAFGVSSDTGVLLGAFVQTVRFEPDARPYAGRLQAQLAASVLDGPDGLELPLHDDYLGIDRPGFPWPSARLGAELAYVRQANVGYYGVGNAAATEARADLTRFAAETVELRANLQQELHGRRLRVWFGGAFALAEVTPPGDGLLARDVASGAAPPGVGRYARTVLTLGFLADGRDHETVPTRGVAWDASVRWAPGGLGDYRYAGAASTVRAYTPLAGDRLVLASRLVVDVLAGDAPLVELGRFGGVRSLPGPGGAYGIRGLPQNRLLGKTKAFGNVELRSLFLPFSTDALGDMTAGAAAFADAGRVWTRTFAADPARDDGRVHAGFGGGPRLRWGDSFLLRADLAFAPRADAAGTGTAVGFYLTGDSAF